MMKTLQQIISWIFTPLAMPVLAMLIVFYTPSAIDFSTHMNALYFINDQAKSYLLSLFFMFSWLFPVVSLLILRYTKQVDSIELNVQSQRFVPIILSGIYAAMLAALLFKLNTYFYISRHLFAMATSGVLVAIACILINRFFKISMHAAGAGMLIGFLASYYSSQALLIAWPFYFAIMLGGIVISSRIYLKKHTNFELVSGFLLGLSITYLSDVVWINVIKL